MAPMLALTHLFIALLMIRMFDLDKNTAFATLLFGVFIDLDHIFGMIDFVAKEGWGNALNINAALTSDIQWKSLIHSPEGGLFVGAVCLSFRMVVPILAWGLHLILDQVQMQYLGIASPAELVLIAVLTLALLAYERRDHDEAVGRTSIGGFIRWEVTRVSEVVMALPGLSSLRRWRVSRGTSS